MVNRTNYARAVTFLENQRQAYSLRSLSERRYWFYLRHLLLWVGEKPLAEADRVTPSFSAYLKGVKGAGSSLPLKPATLRKILQITRRFFQWLKSSHPKEFRGLPANWIKSLSPPGGSDRQGDHVFVTLEEAIKLATTPLPKEGLTGLRDRAAAAMLFVSGMRASAFSSLPISAVDLPSRTVRQFPSLGVRTKNSKAAVTYLLKIPELLAVVEEWDAVVRSKLPPTAMWYAPLISRWGVPRLSADLPGANRNIMLAKRLGKLQAAIGLPVKSPHKFRHGHAVYGLQHARTMADYKAVSMNLMHNDIRITDAIYAVLSKDEVQSRIAALSGSAEAHIEMPGDVATLVKDLPPEKFASILTAIVEHYIRQERSLVATTAEVGDSKDSEG